MIAARTQVKEILKEAGIPNMSQDFMERLDEKVKLLVQDAAARAKANLRRTVMSRDL